MLLWNLPGGGGGGGTWVQFCWVCAAGLSEPLPHYSLFLWPVIDPILVTFWENVIFAIPTKSLSIYFFFLTPKINPKMCDPILVTLLKMQPHSSKSSRENATPSSGTSPLASYKGVPPPPPGGNLISVGKFEATDDFTLINHMLLLGKFFLYSCRCQKAGVPILSDFIARNQTCKQYCALYCKREKQTIATSAEMGKINPHISII